MEMLTFLYPGQGSQRIGMGTELRKHAPDLFEHYLKRADTVTGLPITDYCQEGPIEALTRTEVAQPALFTLSLALTAYAQQLGLQPAFVAGHSLGEYTAAVVAGVLSFEDGLYLVCQRGKLMAQVQAAHPGAMGAIQGLSSDKVNTLCQAATQVGMVTIANVNAPTQYVVAGDDAGVARLLELALQHGAEKALRLRTGAAFHSAFMQPVQVQMQQIAQTLTWYEPNIPLIANVTGDILTSAAAIRQALLEQITQPVQWVNCMQTVLDAGCRHFLELGSGRVLTGLLRLIASETDAFATDSPQKIETFMQKLGELTYG